MLFHGPVAPTADVIRRIGNPPEPSAHRVERRPQTGVFEFRSVDWHSTRSNITSNNGVHFTSLSLDREQYVISASILPRTNTSSVSFARSGLGPAEADVMPTKA